MTLEQTSDLANGIGRGITHGAAPFVVAAFCLCLVLLVHLIAKKLARDWADRQ